MRLHQTRLTSRAKQIWLRRNSQLARQSRIRCGSKSFEYLPRTFRNEIPEHIKQLTTRSNQFAQLTSLNELNEFRAVSQRFPQRSTDVRAVSGAKTYSTNMTSDILANAHTVADALTSAQQISKLSSEADQLALQSVKANRLER